MSNIKNELKTKIKVAQKILLDIQSEIFSYSEFLDNDTGTELDSKLQTINGLLNGMCNKLSEENQPPRPKIALLNKELEKAFGLLQDWATFHNVEYVRFGFEPPTETDDRKLHSVRMISGDGIVSTHDDIVEAAKVIEYENSR